MRHLLATNSNTVQRRHHAISLEQASQEAPTLARLAALVQESNARLQALRTFMPATLHAQVQAGPIQGDTWCLLVRSNAAANKLRQLTPLLITHLKKQGWEVNAIRLKIQTG